VILNADGCRNSGLQVHEVVEILVERPQKYVDRYKALGGVIFRTLLCAGIVSNQ
jgi:hypothetical protein